MRALRVLHVAALAFPSPQGTQALIDQMLRAHAAAGHQAELLCYAHGERERQVPYVIHRIPDTLRTRGMRSGPSWRKPLLDAQLFLALRRVHASFRPDLVIAHHVEGAAVAAAVLGRGFTFYAHTDMGAELPDYFPRVPRSLPRSLGRIVDHALVAQAARSLAVSPLLAQRLALPATSAPSVPWPVASLPTQVERHRARARLGIGADEQVALYCGNLDAYQGLDVWLHAFARLAPAHPRLRFLLVTASEPEALRLQLRARGLLDQTYIARLDPHTRERAHAAADVAIVPRRAPGGVPIKLLDALARGLPTVAVERALAGLPIADGLRSCSDQPAAVADAVEGLLCDPSAEAAAGRAAMAQRGRDYIRSEHDPAAWAHTLVDTSGSHLGVRSRRLPAAMSSGW